MRKSQHLTGNKQFSLVHREGKSWANHFLVIKILPNYLDTNRFGFLVGKRLGNAVRRNYIRRRLKETVRLADIQSGWDVIIIARRGSGKADWSQLNNATEKLLAKANIVSYFSESKPEPMTMATKG